MEGFFGKNFGYVIAFLIPGFIGLWGLSYISPVVNSWIIRTPELQPTVGGFLYTILASITMGLLLHTTRWAILDPLHHITGIAKPKLDFSKLKGIKDEIDYIIQNHDRYYQFYGNTFMALIMTYSLRQFSIKLFPWTNWKESLVILFILVLLFGGSRDTLKKVYSRTAALMRS